MRFISSEWAILWYIEFILYLHIIWIYILIFHCTWHIPSDPTPKKTMPTVYKLWLCGQASRSPTNHPRAYGRTCPAPSRPMILGVPPKSSDVFLTCLASWEYFLFLWFFLAVWEVFFGNFGKPHILCIYLVSLSIGDKSFAIWDARPSRICGVG